MKKFKFGLAGIAICGLLSACGTSEVKPIEETKVKAVATNEDEIVEFSSQAKEWIAKMLAEFNRPPEDSFEEFGSEEVGFVYYKKADELYRSMHEYINDKNESYDEDFANLRMLAAGISHNQFVRTAHIENTGKEMTNLEHAKDWTPMPEETEKAFEYMRQLLNDIDVAINKDGKGTTFGVSHLLDGGNVNKLESFISHGG